MVQHRRKERSRCGGVGGGREREEGVIKEERSRRS